MTMWRRFKQWCWLTDWVNVFGVAVIVGIAVFTGVATWFMVYGALTADVPPNCQ